MKEIFFQHGFLSLTPILCMSQDVFFFLNSIVFLLVIFSFTCNISYIYRNVNCQDLYSFHFGKSILHLFFLWTFSSNQCVFSILYLPVITSQKYLIIS